MAVAIPVQIVVTRDHLASALTQWEQDLRNNPAEYESDPERYARTPEDVGRTNADHLFDLLAQVRS